MKIAIAGVLGLAVIVAMALVALAWIKGGVQPAQPVEIPVEAVTTGAAGA